MVNTYVHGHHETVMRSHRTRTAENSAGYLLPHLRPGMSLLDIGCGPGTVTADLAARIAPGRLTALEPTDAALDLARAECADRGLDNVDFRTGDAHRLNLPDASFDVVHAHQVLQYLADPPAALREMGRVCRPGGVVAVRDCDYAAFAWYPEVPALADWLDLYRRVARAHGGEPDAGRRLLKWARQAGFTDITPSAGVWSFAGEAGESGDSAVFNRPWWGEMWAERILRSDIADQALAAGLAAPADLQRISDGWREWAADPDGWLIVPHAELICRPGGRG